MYTTKPALCASAGNPGPRTHSSTNYVGAAVLAKFGTRDARAIDYDGFIDRKPQEAPRLSPACWRRGTNGAQRVELADLIGQVGA